MFFCFLVSWFQSFLVSRFESVLVFLVSTFQSFNEPILPKTLFHVLWKILIPYSRFSKTTRRIFSCCSASVFPNMFKISDFQNADIYATDTFQNVFGFSWIIWSILVSPKINNIGFGAQGHVKKSRIHRNEGFSVSLISKSKSY